jgi:CheY-like chemotaxis protein
MVTASAGRQSSPIADPPRKLRILIAEDNQDAADSLAIILNLFGHHTQIALNGLDAVQMAHEYQPDVMLLDIGMPGLNGYEVARQLDGPLQEKKPLIIAVTGYAAREDLLRSAEAGMSLHLIKPVDPYRLRDILSRVARSTL